MFSGGSIYKTVRFAIVRAFYMLTGFRIGYWRREIERLWKLNQDDYIAYLDAALSDNQPLDGSGNVVDSLSTLMKGTEISKDIFNGRPVNNTKNKMLFSRYTSGTSGTRTKVYLSKDELSRMLAVRDHCFRQYGIKLGQREARMWGVSSPGTRSRIKDWLLNRKTFCVVDDSLGDIVQSLLRWRPDYIYGYSSSVLNLSKHIVDNNIAIPGVKLVVCTAEEVLPAHKRIMNTAFDAPVAEEYGSTEFDVIAFEDRDGDLALVNPWLIVESTESGLVITDVYRSTQSLVRYQIGDIADIVHRKTSLKRLPIISNLRGRSGDRYVYGGHGKMFHASEISRALNDFFEEGHATFDFTVVQNEIGTCVLHVSEVPDIDLGDLCLLLAKRLRERTSTNLGVLPGTVGKLRQFKGKRSYFIQNTQRNNGIYANEA
jgi:phenylacetate-CoA ligase